MHRSMVLNVKCLYYYICLILKEHLGMLWFTTAVYVFMNTWCVTVCHLFPIIVSLVICAFSRSLVSCTNVYVYYCYITICTTVGDDIYIVEVDRCMDWFDVSRSMLLAAVLFMLLSSPLLTHFISVAVIRILHCIKICWLFTDLVRPCPCD